MPTDRSNQSRGHTADAKRRQQTQTFYSLLAAHQPHTYRFTKRILLPVILLQQLNPASYITPLKKLALNVRKEPHFQSRHGGGALLTVVVMRRLLQLQVEGVLPELTREKTLKTKPTPLKQTINPPQQPIHQLPSQPIKLIYILIHQTHHHPPPLITRLFKQRRITLRTHTLLTSDGHDRCR